MRYRVMPNISSGTTIVPNAELYVLKAACYYYLGEDASAKQEVDKVLQIETTNRTAIVLQNLLKE